MTHPRLIEMRRRVARIRRLVVACAIAAFIAVFSTIYVQMATGNDPVLAATTASTTTTTDSTTTDESDPTTSDESDSTTTDSSEDDSEPAAVTTAQS